LLAAKLVHSFGLFTDGRQFHGFIAGNSIHSKKNDALFAIHIVSSAQLFFAFNIYKDGSNAFIVFIFLFLNLKSI